VVRVGVAVSDHLDERDQLRAEEFGPAQSCESDTSALRVLKSPCTAPKSVSSPEGGDDRAGTPYRLPPLRMCRVLLHLAAADVEPGLADDALGNSRKVWRNTPWPRSMPSTLRSICAPASASSALVVRRRRDRLGLYTGKKGAQVTAAGRRTLCQDCSG